ncbi:MAG: amidohydrolase [Bryobacteraceae bacterium]
MSGLVADAFLPRFATILLVAFLAHAPITAQTADLLFYNANIYTADPKHPRASALAISAGRILAAGDDLSAHTGPDTQRIDLHGATVTPGFIDSHGHMAGLGQSLETLDLRDARSPADAARIVAEAAARLPHGEWIVGRGWDQTRWSGGGFPDSAPLDRAAPLHPVYLTRVDGHAAWVNQRALQIADVNGKTADPPGGRIHRANGRPTGILIDRATSLVSRKIPPPDAATIALRIERAARECARLGLTSVHDAGVGEREIAAYRDLIAKGRLPIRVYAMIGGEGELWRHYLAKGPEIGERLTVRSIKLMADGALGSRGAALLAPYSDDPEQSGLLILQKEDVERVARDAVKAGFQVNTHAIGDRANRMVLQAYAAALGGANNRRFRIEHAQIVSPADFDLFAKYSIIASMQATHATSDMRWAEQRLGPDRIAGAYAWKQMLDRGVVLANGSDFPVESPDPMLGFHAAVTRQDRYGNPPGGWRNQETLTRDEALHSWTAAGAYAAGEEAWKGTLSPGKIADFIVLSNDIMTVPAPEIPDTRILRTVVGGHTARIEQFHGIVPVPAGTPKYVELGAIDRPATVVCRFHTLQPGAALRVMVISKEDLEWHQKQGWDRLSAAGRFVSAGELRVPIRQPGDYILVFDQEPQTAGPARNRPPRERSTRVLIDLAFEYDIPVAPRHLSTTRRFAVLGASLGLLAMICGVGSWKILRAFQTRDDAD